MNEKEIVQIIQTVLETTETVINQLRAEKKETGDYSKSLDVQHKDLLLRFNAMEYKGKFPSPRSGNLIFYVVVFREDVPLMKCRVGSAKHCYNFHFVFNGVHNYSDKFKLCALLCDHSQVKPLFRSGDTLCIDNKGKAAFAKVEVLSEKLVESLDETSVECVRRIRLTEELGHRELLAHARWKEMETYVADDSTREFFGGKDIIEMDLLTWYATTERHSGDFYWLEFTEEYIPYGNELKLTAPTSPAEIIKQLKQNALNELLEKCQGEFCYGDPRVKKYKDNYKILKNEIVDEIYRVYMAWLKKNCKTYTQEGADCTGIAIDWQGKEDYKPHFDVEGDNLKIEYYDDLWEKLPLIPYMDFLIGSYWINRHLNEPYKNLLDFYRNAARDGKVCLALFKSGYDPRSVTQFFSELTTDLENVFVEAIKKIDEAYDMYSNDFNDYKRYCKTLLGKKN